MGVDKVCTGYRFMTLQDTPDLSPLRFLLSFSSATVFLFYLIPFLISMPVEDSESISFLCQYVTLEQGCPVLSGVGAGSSLQPHVVTPAWSVKPRTRFLLLIRLLLSLQLSLHHANNCISLD